MMTNGHLRVDLIRKGDDHDDDVNLKVALIMVDSTLEVMETATREETKGKDVKRARVTFPIVKLCSQIHQLTFFVVGVSISVGGKVVVETSSDQFTMTDYNTFLAWRSDHSDW